VDTQAQVRTQRAAAIAATGGIEEALAAGTLSRRLDLTLSEALVLGLLRQGVRTYLAVLGHGSTDVGEVLRIYQGAGLVRTLGLRNEVEASHAATALRWVSGQKAAVVTSIGPGALQAMAGSLAAASDGIGVWHIYGDETTQDEGPNMQQVPKAEQGLFHRLASTMGHAYTLHTPEAISTALRRGANVVDHPHRGGPFYLLLPLNTQPAILRDFNLDELPVGGPPPYGAAAGEAGYEEAAERLLSADRVVVKLGGGARGATHELLELLDLVDGFAVSTPIATGVIPFSHPRYMTLGGSKGSISGNFAMEQADLLLAVGTRSVCQSDCSRTGYPKVQWVVNLNTDPDAAMHYTRTTALLGDAAATLRVLIECLRRRGAQPRGMDSGWAVACRDARKRWEECKAARFASPALFDDAWGEVVLTQPATVKAVTDWARSKDAVVFFDAGDVQANGMQIVEDDRVGRTFTESGASYMGFAASAVLATAASEKPFYAVALSGDGSFTMNPQVLIDGVAHGARGCIVVLDNRRMGAISSLQVAQYGVEHATADHVVVDYVAWASSVSGVVALDGGRSVESLLLALDKAYEHEGLSFVHVPVYWGPHPMGGLEAFGRWNVGAWAESTQRLRHDIGL